jgi:hypothetical protein
LTILNAVLSCYGADVPTETNQSRQNPSLALSPAVVEVKAQPGLSSTYSLTLANLTATDFDFVLEASDVVVRDGKRVFVPAGETEGGIARSAVFSTKTLSLKPGESGHVNVTLTVPEHPKVRAVAVVFHGLTPVRRVATAMFTGSLGALITFNLSNNVNLRAAQPVILAQTESSNLTVHQSLENAGDEPVIPKGTLAILKDSGELLARVAIEPHRLLPGEKLECAIEYPHTLREGKYRALVSLAYEGGVSTTSGEFRVLE